MLGLAAVWAGLAALSFRAFRRAREEMLSGGARSGRERALFVAAVLAIALHLIWPAFVGVLLMVALRMLDGVSRRGPAHAVDPESRVAEDTRR